MWWKSWSNTSESHAILGIIKFKSHADFSVDNSAYDTEATEHVLCVCVHVCARAYGCTWTECVWRSENNLQCPSLCVWDRAFSLAWKFTTQGKLSGPWPPGDALSQLLWQSCDCRSSALWLDGYVVLSGDLNLGLVFVRQAFHPLNSHSSPWHFYLKRNQTVLSLKRGEGVCARMILESLLH